jgi:xanthine dehydrogenase molybdopterin-binding subunit B
VHPPVDEQGQTIDPNLELLSKLLDQALGASTAAIHWDLARRTLQAANGIPTVVGLAATPDSPGENAHAPQQTAAADPAIGAR